jgi:hypothetical protein
VSELIDPVKGSWDETLIQDVFDPNDAVVILAISRDESGAPPPQKLQRLMRMQALQPPVAAASPLSNIPHTSSFHTLKKIKKYEKTEIYK